MMQAMTATAIAPNGAIYQRPWMYPKQERAVFTPARYAVIEASTKTGKTVGCMVWIAELAMQGRPGWNYWWVAPIYSQARIAFRRLKRALPRQLYRANESELTITLANQAVIWFKGAENPDSLYGEDVYGAVIDESTRVREASWIAVRSTLTATKGPLRIIGNVKGRKNWAYKMARRAESGAPNMVYTKITAYDAVEAGILDLAEVEDARAQLPESAFRELYLAEPSDDEGNPFGGSAAINACITPLSDLPPAAWGWDLAKSQDWTVGIALDEHGDVCRLLRFQKPWNDTITTIDQETGYTQALVDSTGVGDPVLEALQARRHGVYEGFKFTAQSKQQLMEGLAIGIQQRAIGFPEGVISSELSDFEYVYTRTGVKYKAPEGLFDDAVMALGLAWHKLGHPTFDDQPSVLPIIVGAGGGRIHVGH
jgi:hypothetical protein